MNRKRLACLALSLAMSVVFSGCGNRAEAPAQASDNSYQKLDLKISVATGETGIDYLTAQRFSDSIKEASGGVVTATVYSNSQLTGGDMSKTLDMLLAGGSFEIATASGAVLSNIDEKFLVHQLPFVFSSYTDASGYLDGTGGAYYKELLGQKNVTLLGTFHNGIKQITNGKKEIHSPADLKGMKIRIPSGEVAMKTYQAFGADPVSMNWGEVYTALQQGTIDGHDNGYMTIASASIQEVNPYITECNWQYECYTLIANSTEFGKWNEKTQQLILDQADEATKWARSYLEEQEQQIKKDFVSKSVTITALTAEEWQQFYDATADVRSYFIEKYGADACAAWGITA